MATPAVLVIALLGVVLSGCSFLNPLQAEGEVATWQIHSVPEPDADGTTLQVDVTRVGCAGGSTGTVLEPRITVEDDRVVISTQVERLRQSGADCQGNDSVVVELELGADAIGKDLVDHACLEPEVGDTPMCAAGPVRWHLPEVAALEQIPTWTEPEAYHYQVTSRCGERSFLGAFDIAVEAGEVVDVGVLADLTMNRPQRDAMTLGEILEEAERGLKEGRSVRVSLDAEGDPRFVSVGDDLAQSDTSTCYVIHGVQRGGQS